MCIWLHWEELWDWWVNAMWLDIQTVIKQNWFCSDISYILWQSDISRSKAQRINKQMHFSLLLLSKLNQCLAFSITLVLGSKIRLLAILDILKAASHRPGFTWILFHFSKQMVCLKIAMWNGYVNPYLKIKTKNLICSYWLL